VGEGGPGGGLGRGDVPHEAGQVMAYRQQPQTVRGERQLFDLVAMSVELPPDSPGRGLVHGDRAVLLDDGELVAAGGDGEGDGATYADVAGPLRGVERRGSRALGDVKTNDGRRWVGGLGPERRPRRIFRLARSARQEDSRTVRRERGVHELGREFAQPTGLPGPNVED